VISLPSRETAEQLLFEYTTGESLRKHAFAVEAAMRAYARILGEDEERWGMAGLLHDFDYERHPRFPDHPTIGSSVLAEQGYPEDIRHAILGHVPAMNVPRNTAMARALFACDELCGLVVACAIVRPGKLSDLEVGSVRKKMKDKAFARGVNREEIVNGAKELGVDLDEHVRVVIDSLRGISQRLGL